ncbi:MAG: ATP phosphoribosyltransferase [Coriobacteriales bacterium]|nr:ATP phosphoribosyltransferase [Coriobacteriales bacterium]
MIHRTPRGFRDILPQEALARERITETIRSCFSSHGYLPVETPILEDRSVIETAGRIQDSPFQLFDKDDRLLMLRPDLTLPIARMVASRLGSNRLPARLRYVAPVVREQGALRGQPRQFTQLGVELVGGEGADSEAEVVSLLADALARLGVPDWYVVCGSVAPLTALLKTCGLGEGFSKKVLRLVHDSDLVGLDELVLSEEGLTAEQSKAICELVRLNGDEHIVERLDALMAGAGVPEESRGVSALRHLVASCAPLVRQGRLRFDFSIINNFDYYTGLVFKAYAEGIAASLASGGHYDAVLANLGLPNVSACGFAMSLERLQEVLGEEGDSGVVTPGVRLADRPLRIAIPKGSLFPDTLKVLEAAGLPVEGLRDLGRKLIVREDGVEYVIVRAQDAPSFVAFGGADCGICGRDSIIEADVDLLQLVDLRYGWCRFVVAEPADAAGKADRAYKWRGTMRVATKYPRITQEYYDRIGQQVDIVQLHGNIELGPIVGMTDRIVDITATGTTLAENDLVIVDDVLECTARFFAGPAAYRCDLRIRTLAQKLANVVSHKREENS